MDQPNTSPFRKEHCAHCAFKSPLFKLLSEDELELMNRNRHEVMYNPGEVIFKQGSPLTHVISYNFGLAKMQVEGKNGNRLILRLVKPVEFICGMGLFTDSRNQFSLIAVKKSSVCYIDKENFLQVLHSNKTFLEAFLHLIEKLHARNLSKILNHNEKHAAGRVAESLLYLSGEIFSSNSFDTHLSTQELAELSGISRESAFKVLNDLSGQGVISREGSQFSILNPSMLQTISRNG